MNWWQRSVDISHVVSVFSPHGGTVHAASQSHVKHLKRWEDIMLKEGIINMARGWKHNSMKKVLEGYSSIIGSMDQLLVGFLGIIARDGAKAKVPRWQVILGSDVSSHMVLDCLLMGTIWFKETQVHNIHITHCMSDFLTINGDMDESEVVILKDQIVDDWVDEWGRLAFSSS